MNLLKKVILTAIPISLLGSAICQAQSSDMERGYQSSSEARLAITLPFGTSANKHKEKPRLELISRRSTDNRSDLNWAVSESFQENRLGITLSKSPAMSLNGQIIEFDGEEQLGLSSGTKEVLIIGGLALAIVIMASTLSDEERERFQELNPS